MSGYVSDYFAYKASVELAAVDRPFYALIMAAMRKADTWNALALRAAFPEVWDDLQARHDAPGGVLPTDAPSIRAAVLGGGT